MERIREIKHYHEFLPKQERPSEGGQYLVSMNGTPAYIGTFVKYDGGCWATVRLDEVANKEYESLYTPGMSFDIKVAHYTFQEMTSTEE